MLFVGLTGGIGSGKSTVAALLAERGAVVVDADLMARRAVVLGSPGYARVVERFGSEVLLPDGDLDRQGLADRVFADDDERQALEGIVHPEVRRLVSEAVAAHVGTDDVVVVDSPLLIESGAADDFDLVVVVSARPSTQVARSQARGMDADDAHARIAAQLPLADKTAVADIVIDNDGSREELEAQVEELWVELRRRSRQ